MIKKVFNKENILDIVQDFPGVSSSEIAKKLGMSRVSAYLYLQSLISEGLIRIDGNGKATRYFPQEVGYINHTLKESGISLTPSQVHILKIEILNSLYEKYEEDITEEDIDTTFEKYCMYITSDGVIRTGFIAFILWCMDTKHKFSDRIVAKSVEYLDLIGSIEYLRKKNGFFDGSEAARTNLL